jgi:hypothetical protein
MEAIVTLMGLIGVMFSFIFAGMSVDEEDAGEFVKWILIGLFFSVIVAYCGCRAEGAGKARSLINEIEEYHTTKEDEDIVREEWVMKDGTKIIYDRESDKWTFIDIEERE